MLKKMPEWKDEALLVLRVVLGVIFIMHGSQKVLGFFGGPGLPATVQFFQSKLGIPPFLGYTVAFTEFFGGIALILGLFTRLAALGIGTNMAVAVAKVHLANGFFLNWFCQGGRGHGFEYNLALIAMALALVLAGGGNYSLDAKFCKCEPK